MSLFEPPMDRLDGGAADRSQPLADRMRPRTLDDLLGQAHLLAPGKPLRVQIERDQLGSILLWGPPGVGKTTLARIIAVQTRRRFVPFSAVTSGIKEIREVMAAAERAQRAGQRTILFIDEIHRFNRAQQDAFLPYVESGAITLIGATTENPSFEVNSALLSRARVYVLEALSDEHIAGLLRRALDDRERGVLQDRAPAARVAINPELLLRMAQFANGDARVALNLLEAAVAGAEPAADDVITITAELLDATLQHKALLYDRGGEQHFNLISALHKSLRNSDVDAGLYWLGRMLEAGEDPLYVARRLVRFASEDVGLADPRALEQALAARAAVEAIGMPEAALALAQAAAYLALAPKSNALYAAYGAVLEDVRSTRADPVPLHLRNAPTALMQGLGYGRGYQYAHDTEAGVTAMECLPENLRGRHYYRPKDVGLETRLAAKLAELERQRRKPGD
ncbi:MAG TPA: replication-associated recombination protein A [Terriglobales bacterium]|nr:replication-associated recombination protein A [Terriglobales bacterium]